MKSGEIESNAVLLLVFESRSRKKGCEKICSRRAKIYFLALFLKKFLCFVSQFYVWKFSLSLEANIKLLRDAIFTCFCRFAVFDAFSNFVSFLKVFSQSCFIEVRFFGYFGDIFFHYLLRVISAPPPPKKLICGINFGLILKRCA